ncbi:hypothetical protein [Yinghuangia soli]|uniref:Uncharacterized protein n=1 Tax=Yinghuangia soli TaxID=2908204 RepID=A0AA41Q805_9ACTN|nr:hypothetical protein [Yinghuangia soli]MCF2531867.1 hypothetical protein [Yinghuangia soli]
MHDVPDTLAPHEAIETEGRGRRRRRSVIGGSVAAILVAAGLAGAVTFIGGDGDGNSASVAGSPTTVTVTSAPPTQTPAPAPTTPAAEDKLVLASGTTADGKPWEVVRVLGASNPPGSPSRPTVSGPGGKPVDRSRQEHVYLTVNGSWQADISGRSAGTQWPWDPAVSSGHPVNWLHRASGSGQSVIVSQVTPEVAKLELVFADGTKMEGVAKPVPDTPEGFVVIAFPTKGGNHGGSFTFTAYDAAGKNIYQWQSDNTDK